MHIFFKTDFFQKKRENCNNSSEIYTQTYKLTYSQTNRLIHRHTFNQTQRGINTHSDTTTHMHTDAHTHISTRRRTNAQTHTLHIHIHAETQKHKHTESFLLGLSPFIFYMEIT